VDGLEGILVGLAARYPSLLNTTLMVHLFCVAIVIGTVVAFDLRLLGFWRWLPVRDLHRVLIPLSLVAIIPAAASGALLYAFHADSLVGNGVFVLKMLALFGAAINAMIFATGPWQSVKTWDAQRTPAGAKLCAMVSIGLLMLIAACGVLLATEIAHG
jgi:hypothetical protein